MNTQPTCPECGNPLPKESSHDVCPACLLAQGMATGTGNIVETTPLPDLEEIAGKFPQFEILECLGRGGMGVVYKARQKSLNRLVALKVLAPEREHDAHFAARFSREAEILARLNHPQIVTIHDFGESGGLFFLVMEFVDGVNLRDLLREGRMEPRQALAIVPEICGALQYAHDQGIVHRDIKPENILLDRNGQVKVADFGIAKLAGIESEIGQESRPTPTSLTEAGKILGTPAYMAPEQATEPNKVDHRADIYALGAVFYQMLTGETPRPVTEPPSRKVTIDVRLDDIVLRALEKDPERRYQQVSEMRTRLETLRTPVPPASPAPSKKGLAHWIILLVSIPVLILAGVIAALLVLWTSFRPQEDSAEAWKLWNAQRYPEAKRAFEKTIEKDPTNANSWNGLGWTLFNSGHAVEALSAFEKAVQLDTKQPGALNGIGQIALSQGDFRKAEEYLLRAAPMAPAAWFGLTRIHLLEGHFEKALPWAQKVVDSGQGGGMAGLMLEAAKSGKLSETLRQKIAPNATASLPSRPDLRALAWQDQPDHLWDRNGNPMSLSQLPDSVRNATGLDVTNAPEATKNPRFLSCWISDPSFDNRSVTRLELFGSDGKPLTPPSGDKASRVIGPNADNGNVGWLNTVLCAGTSATIPKIVTIRLQYSSGPWQPQGTIDAHWQGTRSLAPGILLTSPFQSNLGYASVQITCDLNVDDESTQWNFVAHTQDGRSLERRSISQQGTAALRVEVLDFECPLSEVKRFEIRMRSIKSITWPNVPLLAENGPIELLIHADGKITHQETTWAEHEMKDRLKEWGQLNPDQSIILQATENCSYDRIKEVLDQCASAGIRKIAFSNKRKSP